MGNALRLLEDETESGKQLLIAIRTGSVDAVKEAVENTRQMCVNPHGSRMNPMNYDDMLATMTKYLSQSYADADRMTPSEYARSMGFEDIAAHVEREIARLQHAAEAPTRLKNEADSMKKTQATRNYNLNPDRPVAIIDDATEDRVALAKARLKAFQASKK